MENYCILSLNAKCVTMVLLCINAGLKQRHTNTLTRFLVYLALPDAMPNLMKYASKSLPEPSLLILQRKHTHVCLNKSCISNQSMFL